MSTKTLDSTFLLEVGVMRGVVISAAKRAPVFLLGNTGVALPKSLSSDPGSTLRHFSTSTAETSPSLVKKKEPSRFESFNKVVIPRGVNGSLADLGANKVMELTDAKKYNLEISIQSVGSADGTVERRLRELCDLPSRWKGFVLEMHPKGATDKKQPIYASCYSISPSRYHISSCSVAEKYQRKGIHSLGQLAMSTHAVYLGARTTADTQKTIQGDAANKHPYKLQDRIPSLLRFFEQKQAQGKIQPIDPNVPVGDHVEAKYKNYAT